MNPERLAEIESQLRRNPGHVNTAALGLELVAALKEAGCVAPVASPEPKADPPAVIIPPADPSEEVTPEPKKPKGKR